MDRGKDIKWVKVYSALDMDEANMVRGMLETNDIRCFVKENATPTLNYPPMLTDAGIPILVLEKDESAAMELMRREVKIENEES